MKARNGTEVYRGIKGLSGPVQGRRRSIALESGVGDAMLCEMASIRDKLDGRCITQIIEGLSLQMTRGHC